MSEPREHPFDLAEPRGAADDAAAAALARRLEDAAPTDGAAALARLDPVAAAEVATLMAPTVVAAALAELDDAADAADIVRSMRPPEAAIVLAAMHPDDRVDVLGHVRRPLHDQIVAELDAFDAADVRRLEQHPPDTAGGIMTTEAVALSEDTTVGDAVAELRRLRDVLEQASYVYVKDAAGRLIGVLSMRDLVLAPAQTSLAALTRREVVTVPADMDQERVAQLMRRWGFLALPVVDADRRLLGVVTVDDVLDVLQEEATEDVQRMVGAGPEERLNSPWAYSFSRRLPWLLVNLVLAFVAASVVALYEETVARWAILAMYMPVVAGMGGNASAQAMAVAIRGMALGEADRTGLRRILWREARVGALSGVITGTAAAVVAMALHYEHGPALGLLVGMALLLNHVVGCVWGASIPFIMRRLDFDPAQSATIFTTTMTDMVGFFVLLGLATAALARLG